LRLERDDDGDRPDRAVRTATHQFGYFGRRRRYQRVAPGFSRV
jgi:hypothetical protein